ncbi:hypothetical protein [Labrys neptuniae]
MKAIAASPRRGADAHRCAKRSESLFQRAVRPLFDVLQVARKASHRNGIDGLNETQLRDIGLHPDQLPDWKPDPWRHLR